MTDEQAVLWAALGRLPPRRRRPHPRVTPSRFGRPAARDDDGRPAGG
ncbi:hypothetical protein AB0J43_03780 [Nonomuraea fuscirosea]